MTETTHLRINLAAGEFELSGSPDFISQYDAVTRELLDRLTKTPVAPSAPAAAPAGAAASPAPVATADDVGAFGEVLHSLSSSATATDQILVAGWYIARSTSDGTFSTAEANKLLLEQGIKVANPSQSLKNCVGAKRAFKMGNRFKVSKTGETHIGSLRGH